MFKLSHFFIIFSRIYYYAAPNRAARCGGTGSMWHACVWRCERARRERCEGAQKGKRVALASLYGVPPEYIQFTVREEGARVTFETCGRAGECDVAAPCG